MNDLVKVSTWIDVVRDARGDDRLGTREPRRRAGARARRRRTTPGRGPRCPRRWRWLVRLSPFTGRDWPHADVAFHKAEAGYEEEWRRRPRAAGQRLGCPLEYCGGGGAPASVLRLAPSTPAGCRRVRSPPPRNARQPVLMLAPACFGICGQHPHSVARTHRAGRPGDRLSEAASRAPPSPPSYPQGASVRYPSVAASPLDVPLLLGVVLRPGGSSSLAATPPGAQRTPVERRRHSIIRLAAGPSAASNPCAPLLRPSEPPHLQPRSSRLLAGLLRDRLADASHNSSAVA
jgi:hypothetical protein